MSNSDAPDWGIQFVFRDILASGDLNKLKQIVEPSGHGLIDGGKWVVIVRDSQKDDPRLNSWPKNARCMVIVDRKDEQKPSINAYYNEESVHHWIRLAIDEHFKETPLSPEADEVLMEIENVEMSRDISKSAILIVTGWKNKDEYGRVLQLVMECLADDYEELVGGESDIVMTFVFRSKDKFTPEHYISKYGSDLIRLFESKGLGHIKVSSKWLS